VDYGKFSLTVKRYVLADLCERVLVAVPSRETLPVLGCFQVQVGHAGLRVAATDMERTVFARTEAVVTDAGDSAEFYVNARKLVAILHAAPDGEVTIKVRKNKAEVTLSNGFTADLRLPDSGAYPQLPDPGTIEFSEFSREKLLGALKSVRHAVCRDASRSNLTQVDFTAAHGGVAVTASDGSRMARAGLPDFPMVAAAPSSATEDLVRLLSSSPDVKNVEVGQTPGIVVFRVGHVVLAATKRQNPFPNVDDQLLKPASGNSDKLVIDRSQLREAIKRVRINADPETSAIALDIRAGEVIVVSRDKSGNSAKESVPVKWDAGNKLVVVNHVSLSEAVDAHPDSECEFLLGADIGKKRSMVLLEGGALLQVLSQMPPALVGY
jgi:DNA polymerase III sliding clamp (beta) subunit (PCNA family)